MSVALLEMAMLDMMSMAEWSSRMAMPTAMILVRRNFAIHRRYRRNCGLDLFICIGRPDCNGKCVLPWTAAMTGVIVFKASEHRSRVLVQHPEPFLFSTVF